MANVRWKDKANLPGASIADADAMPITDDVAGAATDKHVLMSDIATYINTKNASASATLTNKSIDSDDNTLTNIANANIKAAAAIAVNKLAALTASKVVVTDGSGFISADGTTQAELSILDGATCTTAELNLLDAGEDEAVFDGGSDVTIRVGGTNQARVTDGTIEPITNDDINLGSSTKRFKDAYINGNLYLYGGANVEGNIDAEDGRLYWNQLNADKDVKLGSTGSDTMLFLDASADMIGIKNAAPAATLDVTGSFHCTSATIEMMNYAVDAEASDAYVITLAPALTGYKAGLVVYFKANTNNTGACSLNVNGLGAVSIKLQSGADPSNDDIDSRGIAHVVHDGTNFILMNPQ